MSLLWDYRPLEDKDYVLDSLHFPKRLAHSVNVWINAPVSKAISPCLNLTKTVGVCCMCFHKKPKYPEASD